MVWCHKLPPPAPNFFLSHHESHCRGWAAINPQSGWGSVTPYPRPAATEAVYLIVPQEFSYVFMHYTHVSHRKHQLQPSQLMPACVSLQKNSTLAVPGSIWFRGACMWRSEAPEGGQQEELGAFCIWEFPLLSTEQKLERAVEGGGSCCM